MIFFDEIKEQLKVMVFPSKAVKAKPLAGSLAYYYKLSFLPLLLTILLSYLHTSTLSGIVLLLNPGLERSSFLIIALLEVLLLWGIMPLLLLFNALIIYIIGDKLFKALKGKPADTANALIYSLSSLVLFVWLAVVSPLGIALLVIFLFWAFIIEIIALSKLQKLSRLGALAIIIFSSFIISVVSELFALIGVTLFAFGHYLIQ